MSSGENKVTQRLFKSIAASALLLAGASLAFNEAEASFQIQGEREAAYQHDQMVEGYGNNLPVELIVQDIVPAGYEILFDSLVDRTARTSWYGGRPWPEILVQSLQPIGLTFERHGKQVIVAHATGFKQPHAQAAAAPSPVQWQANATGQSMRTPAMMAAPAQPVMAERAHQMQVAQGDSALMAQLTLQQQQIQHLQQLQAMQSQQQSNSELQAQMQKLLEAQTETMRQLSEKTGVSSHMEADKTQEAKLPEAKEWEAKSGKTLRAILQEWSEEAGWALAWQSEHDYPVRASASFYGDFETASSNLIRAFSIAIPPVRGTIYRGNRVLVVSSGVDRER